MKKAILLTIFFLLFPLIFNNSVFAHPGRTSADGCHYCRTRCDYWGVPWNERHCHGGGSVQGVQESVPVYSAPTNTQIPWPTWTPVPTNTPTPTDTPTPTITVTLIPTKKISTPKKISIKKINKQTVKKKTLWQWLFNR